MDPQPEITAGELIDRLSGCDRDAPVRLAINPFFPMAHRLAHVVAATDEDGRPVIFLAEGQEQGAQLGYLPPDVAVALTWQEPDVAPPHRRRSARRHDSE
ncbi:hypothetical protein ABZ707_32090 [Streptomyces sp. NPDC006923]|uniref:hypothetical protein n=1 Tax=Streptomyces sp. NPDC006923 TaxID=3155355 RepID=UPI0033C13F93